jgi:hypothetical protein
MQYLSGSLPFRPVTLAASPGTLINASDPRARHQLAKFDAEPALIVVSDKRLLKTLGRRRRLGPVLGAGQDGDRRLRGLEPFHMDVVSTVPVDASGRPTWAGALLIARRLANGLSPQLANTSLYSDRYLRRSGHPALDTTLDGEWSYWSATAVYALAPMLFLARATKASPRTIDEWLIDLEVGAGRLGRPDDAPWVLIDLLRALKPQAADRHDVLAAIESASAVSGRSPLERQRVTEHVSQVAACFLMLSPDAPVSIFSPTEFLRLPSTLYVVPPRPVHLESRLRRLLPLPHSHSLAREDFEVRTEGFTHWMDSEAVLIADLLLDASVEMRRPITLVMPPHLIARLTIGADARVRPSGATHGAPALQPTGAPA